MAAAAQAQTTLTATDPIQRWLARRGAVAQLHADQLNANQLDANQLEANQLEASMTGSPAPSLRATSSDARRAAINRANSLHSTGPRTVSGKQRSSLNALGHGLTARTAVLPTEDPDTYQRHIQQFLDEYAPATPTETQLVHEIANTAWRLNRIPFLEAELLSRATNPPSEQAAIDFDIVDAHRALATIGLHGSRLSRQFQKALEQLRDIQDERLRLQRRQLTEAAELLLRHRHKGLCWEPSDDGFVFSKEQIELHARKLMRLNPVFYAAYPRSQADPPPTGAAL